MSEILQILELLFADYKIGLFASNAAEFNGGLNWLVLNIFFGQPDASTVE